MAASQLHVALAGNPNCGKTTLFNLITGQNGYVSPATTSWAASPTSSSR